MRLVAALLVFGLVACGGVVSGSSSPAEAPDGALVCPAGEHACGTCDDPPPKVYCGADCVVAPPCPVVPPPPIDAGCLDGETSCADCDGATYCAAFGCPKSLCPTSPNGGAVGDDASVSVACPADASGCTPCSDLGGVCVAPEANAPHPCHPIANGYCGFDPGPVTCCGQ